MKDAYETIADELWERDKTPYTPTNYLVEERRNYRQDVWKRFKTNQVSMASLWVLILLIVLTLIGPLLTPYSYENQELIDANQPPLLRCFEIYDGQLVYVNHLFRMFYVSENGSVLEMVDVNTVDSQLKEITFEVNGKGLVLNYDQKTYTLADDHKNPFLKIRWRLNGKHIFGTDSLGRDLFVRVIFGARISLVIGLVAAGVNLVIGIIYGGISGYYGRNTDMVLMRIVDVIDTIPLLLYVILFMLVLGSGYWSIILAIGLVYWVDMARIVRGQVLMIKSQEFVLAAETIGTSTKNIFIMHLLPHIVGPIVVALTVLIPSAIFLEAFMSFIGLGVVSPYASWGVLCKDALDSLQSFPYQLFIPASVICLTMLAFYYLGDGLRNALDNQ